MLVKLHRTAEQFAREKAALQHYKTLPMLWRWNRK